MVNFVINGKQVSVDVADDTPLLWVIRENLNLTGTKFGCGVAQCGACTVHINGAPTRSCITPASAAGGANITTIEGVAQTTEGKAMSAAWVEQQAPQCGYCQSGQIMTACSLIKNAKGPLSREDVLEGMAGNICRCGTYNQIAAAVISVHKATA